LGGSRQCLQVAQVLERHRGPGERCIGTVGSRAQRADDEFEVSMGELVVELAGESAREWS
jgi:hypothetical protein